MKFSTERQAKIAGLLTEAGSGGSIYDYMEDEVDDMEKGLIHGENAMFNIMDLQLNDELQRAIDKLDMESSYANGGTWEIHAESDMPGFPYRAIFADQSGDELLWNSRRKRWVEADLAETDNSEGAVIESADIRRIIRNEIKRSLANRDPSAINYTSGQVFGKKAPRTLGEVVFGFPGIGFKR